ncbi:MAG: leucyl aminopeptidase family protein, partial [Pseudomonadota bacterium]
MYKAFTVEPDAPIRVHLFTTATWPDAELAPAIRTFAESQGFSGTDSQTVMMPDADGRPANVLFGLGDASNALSVAALAARLPQSDYAIATAPSHWDFAWSAAGWADGAYRFDRYRSKTSRMPRLAI